MTSIKIEMILDISFRNRCLLFRPKNNAKIDLKKYVYIYGLLIIILTGSMEVQNKIEPKYGTVLNVIFT